MSNIKKTHKKLKKRGIKARARRGEDAREFSKRVIAEINPKVPQDIAFEKLTKIRPQELEKARRLGKHKED